MNKSKRKSEFEERIVKMMTDNFLMVTGDGYTAPSEIMTIIEKFREEIEGIVPELKDEDIIGVYEELERKGIASPYVKVVLCLLKWLGFREPKKVKIIHPRLTGKHEGAYR